MKYIDLRVIALTDEDVNNFLALCAIIQDANHRGAGKTITVVVDGDGSGVPEFMVNWGNGFEQLKAGEEKILTLDKIYLGE